MLLSKAQQNRFWREWSIGCKRQGWDKVAGWTGLQIDKERHALLERAGFDSLTRVDPLDGFDRVLAELAVLSRPDDIDPQLRAQAQPKLRLVYAIEKLASQISTGQQEDGTNSYAAAIAADRFGTGAIDNLSLHQLEQLRNTLAARLTAHRRRQREATSSPVGANSENAPF